MARREPGLADILAALREFGHAVPRRPPGDGWYTPTELAEMEGVTVAAMKYRIAMARKRGRPIETAVGTMPDKAGFAKRAVFFRLSKNGKK